MKVLFIDLQISTESTAQICVTVLGAGWGISLDKLFFVPNKRIKLCKHMHTHVCTWNTVAVSQEAVHNHAA